MIKTTTKQECYIFTLHDNCRDYYSDVCVDSLQVLQNESVAKRLFSSCNLNKYLYVPADLFRFFFLPNKLSCFEIKLKDFFFLRLLLYYYFHIYEKCVTSNSIMYF